MAATIRVTVLVENTAHGPRLLGEHGLAYWIEWEDCQVLLDTGQGIVLAGNAYKLNVPLHQAEAVILSHGHYDHSGGLAVVSRSRGPVVYAHPAAWQPKFARQREGGGRDMGMPQTSQRAVAASGAAVIGTTVPTTVLDRLTVTGPVPRLTDFEDPGGPFFLDPDCTQPDALVDDQAVFFEVRDGLVVLLGCAHSGVVNTLRYVSQLTDGKPIRAVLGGMHLVEASPRRLARTIESLRTWDIRLLAPGHCTGMNATAALWQAFPGRCTTCHVGARFEFDTP
jgi:7,8-dihydropterin-6-yl-methyl-4-(beta-D-ribofuranosyl)aminobenzene 5'-phosphate synthase